MENTVENHPKNVRYDERKIKEMVKCRIIDFLLTSVAPVPGPLNLRSGDVDTDSFQVSWDHSANDIVLYRLSWAPIAGGDTKEVSANKMQYMDVCFCHSFHDIFFFFLPTNGRMLK